MTARLEVLLEGESDMPAVREILVRRFRLVENEDFRLHPHRGKGSLPANPLARPEPQRRGLLDQLPAKLRGWAHLGRDACVVVLLDADREPCTGLLARLNAMLEQLPRRAPRVLFRIAIEETESWFIADHRAVGAAYPSKARATVRLARIEPDAVVGAWEKLAETIGVPLSDVTGAVKREWAERIAPHLDLDDPPSPSLRRFIAGIACELEKEST